MGLRSRIRNRFKGRLGQRMTRRIYKQGSNDTDMTFQSSSEHTMPQPEGSDSIPDPFRSYSSATTPTAFLNAFLDLSVKSPLLDDTSDTEVIGPNLLHRATEQVSRENTSMLSTQDKSSTCCPLTSSKNNPHLIQPSHGEPEPAPSASWYHLREHIPTSAFESICNKDQEVPTQQDDVQEDFVARGGQLRRRRGIQDLKAAGPARSLGDHTVDEMTVDSGAGTHNTVYSPGNAHARIPAPSPSAKYVAADGPSLSTSDSILRGGSPLRPCATPNAHAWALASKVTPQSLAADIPSPGVTNLSSASDSSSSPSENLPANHLRLVPGFAKPHIPLDSHVLRKHEHVITEGSIVPNTHLGRSTPKPKRSWRFSAPTSSTAPPAAETLGPLTSLEFPDREKLSRHGEGSRFPNFSLPQGARIPELVLIPPTPLSAQTIPLWDDLDGRDQIVYDAYDTPSDDHSLGASTIGMAVSSPQLPYIPYRGALITADDQTPRPASPAQTQKPGPERRITTTGRPRVVPPLLQAGGPRAWAILHRNHVGWLEKSFSFDDGAFGFEFPEA